MSGMRNDAPLIPYNSATLRNSVPVNNKKLKSRQQQQRISRVKNNFAVSCIQSFFIPGIIKQWVFNAHLLREYSASLPTLYLQQMRPCKASHLRSSHVTRQSCALLRQIHNCSLNTSSLHRQYFSPKHQLSSQKQNLEYSKIPLKKCPRKRRRNRRKRTSQLHTKV